MVEISAKELGAYIENKRSCRISEFGCRLQARHGMLVLNLSDFGDVISYKICARRCSGNGAISVSGSKDEVIVASKVSQLIDVDVDQNSRIHLVRPKTSTGDIDIYGVVLDIEDETDIKGENVINKWKLLISKCSKHNGLRLAREKLFASEGAFIDYNGVIALKTKPENSYIVENNRVRFIGPCEIRDIIFKDSAKRPPVTKQQNVPMFAARNVPAPAAIPEANDSTAADLARYDITKYKAEIPITIDSAQSDLAQYVSYDSDAVGGFDKFKASRTKMVKHIHSNGKDYVLLKSGSSCTIPLSPLEADTSYICIVNSKKIGGNGKIFFGFVADEATPKEIKNIIADDRLSDKYISIKTGKKAFNKPHKLYISMPKEHCSGDVLIGRVLIVKDIHKEKIDPRKPISIIDSSGICGLPPVYSITEDLEINDNAYKLSKMYSRYPFTASVNEKYEDISGNISATTVSGMRWISKIGGFFPNLKIIDSRNDFINNKLLICKAGAVRPADRVWIDVFDEDSFSDDDVKILKECKMIFSPSLSNVQFLENACPNVTVHLSHRPLPAVPFRKSAFFTNKNFALTFNRNDKITKMLIDVWDQNWPQLAVVGARGMYPENVIAINEYLPYEELLFIFSKAKFIIDIPLEHDYHSSFLSFACIMGVPVVSSNWFVMDKKNCEYMLRDGNVDNIKVPSADTIKSGINSILRVKSNCKVDYKLNQDMKKCISAFYSA